ncbi:hypothetical protein RGQ13_08925 [Thalassotalea psychrophila]|uniref:Uncharacterized protein n=1 Tax=Thalassotalea psychrophila TaxID=3065647 RepID=A0ABY9TZV2_9GAMM|nr:hypothetical protein RGQ13_08925 [Colwelliaceae bacterium SQ149]
MTASELSDYIMILMIINGALSYYYGRGKVRFPLVAVFFGVTLSIIPPLGIIYVTVLMLKNENVDPEKERKKDEKYQNEVPRRPYT